MIRLILNHCCDNCGKVSEWVCVCACVCRGVCVCACVCVCVCVWHHVCMQLCVGIGQDREEGSMVAVAALSFSGKVRLWPSGLFFIARMVWIMAQTSGLQNTQRECNQWMLHKMPASIKSQNLQKQKLARISKQQAIKASPLFLISCLFPQ